MQSTQSMQPLRAEAVRREITANKVRVIDDARATVEFIATTASIDCYGEVVDPKGVDLSRFEKNAPLLDSHSYSSIASILGKINDTRLEKGQLILTAQFAVEVPENNLARTAFAMVKAGYLKGCSIGFIPTKVLTRADGDDWTDAIDDLDLADDADNIRCIYRNWILNELSLCCIGANPDAVAKSYSAGIIEDSDLLRVPQWRKSLQSTQSANPSRVMSKSLGTLLDSIISKSPAPSVAQAADGLESARRGQSETDLFRASAVMRLAMARERRITAHERASEILADGLIREFLEQLPRYLGSGKYRSYDLVIKSLNTSPGSFGGSMLPTGVVRPIWDMTFLNGAFKHFGVVEMDAMQSKVAQATANPTAIWITPSNNGMTIPADTALTGSNLTPEANTIAIILPISRELLADEKANLSYYLLTRFSQAIAGAIDYASTQGNGVNDTANGSQTGMFIDNTITSVNAANGNTTIAQLARADFLAAVAAVSAAALQRECKWVISPSFIAPLMLLVDTQGKEYLLKTPAETGDGTWRLCGFEVVWAAQAPANNTAGSKIAVFGHLPAYMVAIREALEVMLANSTSGFASNQQSFRALGRAFCQTRQASGLATLALAQQ